MTRQPSDEWTAGYEEFMGRWSRPLAERFVQWLDLPAGGHWLDVGTGTGALAAAICRVGHPRSVVACDPSAPFIESARARLTDPRVAFEVAGSGELPSRPGGFDAVVSGLALNFFPDPEGAIEEQLGLLRGGGWIGACVWDYAEGMEFLRHFWDVAVSIDPAAAELDEGRRFPICRPHALESAFAAAGVEQVRVEPITVPTVFSSFEDYWRPFVGGPGPAPGLVATLSRSERRVLKAALRERLGASEGQSIELTARAWAAVGQASAADGGTRRR